MDALDRFAAALAVLIVCFVGATIFKGCWGRPEANPLTIASGDTLAARRQRDIAVQDSLQRLVQQQADSLRLVQRQADRALWVADSLRRLRTTPPPDTAVGAVVYWKARAFTAEASNDSLRAALGSLRAQSELAMAATAQLHAKELQSKDDVIAAANVHITNLQADVDRLSGRCWYLKPLVPCLSRKAEGLTLLGLGAYAGWRLSR